MARNSFKDRVRVRFRSRIEDGITSTGVSFVMAAPAQQKTKKKKKKICSTCICIVLDRQGEDEV